ncbi:MAG: hypoxanthine phosphoribosyltransferase [Sporolactobacillus sp.]|jgi:hypoxanthine phosphoribosyltransferase|nr:hypoxanthine phosphoribosyltransferase [Sporolactobacillus sp.]
MTFEERVMHFIEKHRLIRPGMRVVAGVSGGADSMALLCFLWEKSKELQIRLAVCSVDHRLRGEEAQADLRFVADYCVRLRLPFFGRTVDAAACSRADQLSIEAGARKVRYQAFADAVKSFHADAVALAHHGDDQIETMLMREVRGSAGPARAGIPYRRPFAGAQVIRPFLAVTKADLRRYCAARGIETRFDRSNLSDTHTRNRFRKTVLPFFKEENPAVHLKFQYESERIADDERFLHELARERLQSAVIEQRPGVVVFSVPILLAAPLPLQRRMIHLVLNYLYASRQMKPLHQSIHIENLIRLLRLGRSSGDMVFPGNLTARKRYGTCTIGMFPRRQGQKFDEAIRIPGTTFFPSGSIEACRLPANEHPAGITTNNLIVDLRLIRLPLRVRNRRSGDRMRPNGMACPQKLRRIFINAKVKREERACWPVVTDGSGRVIWLPLLRRALPLPQRAAGDEHDFYKLTYKPQLFWGEEKGMKEDVEEVLITEEEIQQKVREFGAILSKEYEGRFPLVIGVLKGALPFMADLMKTISVPIEIDFMDVSSYGNSTVSSGEVKILKDLDTSVEGRDILIVEDIIDSGLTLSYLVDLFKTRKAESIKIVTLLDKPAGRKTAVHPDLTAFTVPDAFLVGYGLDYAEKYRNLPFIGILKPEIYKQ